MILLARSPGGLAGELASRLGVKEPHARNIVVTHVHTDRLLRLATAQLLCDVREAESRHHPFVRLLELVTAIAASGTKHVAGEALRMDADERSVIFSAGRRSTHNERQHAVGLVFGLETEDSKSAKSGGKAGFRDLRGFHGRELYHGAAGWLLSSTISSAVPRRPSGPGEISLKAVPLLTW